MAADGWRLAREPSVSFCVPALPPSLSGDHKGHPHLATLSNSVRQGLATHVRRSPESSKMKNRTPIGTCKSCHGQTSPTKNFGPNNTEMGDWHGTQACNTSKPPIYHELTEHRPVTTTHGDTPPPPAHLEPKSTYTNGFSEPFRRVTTPSQTTQSAPGAGWAITHTWHSSQMYAWHLLPRSERSCAVR